MKARRDRSQASAELPMTPMIDIVFLLMVFFLVTFKPVDVLSHLEFLRPSGVPGPTAPVLRVAIDVDGFALNGMPVDADGLRAHLRRLGELDRDQAVVLDCSPAAPHERLVAALNHCASAGLGRLSVVSRGGH
jgi:biopolymer transport protein ExbD